MSDLGLAPGVTLEARHVSKKFAAALKRSLGYGLVDLARIMVGRTTEHDRLRPGEFWAVEDVSLRVEAGEAVGVIGANGAGKTTLLRMLCGILPPDKGEIAVRGRVSALIGVGTGFHPHLSGRENVYLNGALLGLTRDEIDAQFDDIASFAELGDFLEAPVSIYSTGMRARLGFAVSTALDPDLLILDEVLATGDIAFRQRCFERLDAVRDRTTLLLVTHMPTHVRRVCDRVVWLEGGRIIADGPTESVLSDYGSAMRSKAEAFTSGLVQDSSGRS